MTGDLPAAALRLMSSLTVRTHERRVEAPKQGGVRPLKRVIQNPGIGRGGNNRKRIIVHGREYASIGAARKALRCCIYKLYEMLRDGRARYASDADQRMVNLGKSHKSYRRA